MISIAHAATEAAHHDGGLLDNPTFWVALAFIVLIVLAAKPIAAKMAAALDARADTIKAQIDEAEKLREEAQELLASFKRRQQEAEEEAAKILQRAKEEAAHLEAKSKKDLENALKRREAAAAARIAQAEKSAIAEVKALATAIAINASEMLMQDGISAQKANELIDTAIAQLPSQLAN